MGGWVVALWLIGGIFFGLAPAGGSPAETTAWLLAKIAFMSGAIIVSFYLIAFTIALTYWPPVWLTPKWLSDDDERVGFVRPKPDWSDRIALVFGLSPAVLVVMLVVVAFDVATGQL
jgi:hypothetical protein